MRNFSVIFFIVFMLPGFIKAQQKTTHVNMIWLGYYNSIHFNKKLLLVSDAQVHLKNWANQWSQLCLRSGICYLINEKFSVTAGFAFFKNAQYKNENLLLKNEWRPWEEISYLTKIKNINFTQRVRTEQRFLQQVVNGTKINDYDYIFRLRYRFDFLFNLYKKLKLLLGNEVLVNPVKINSNLFFDQNRTFAGVNYKLTPAITLQPQYLKIFQKKTDILEDQNVFRLNILEQINLKNYHGAK